MSTINHYLVNVTIDDSAIDKPVTTTSSMQVAVLATDVNDCSDLVIEFYTRTGLGSKMVDSVHTLYRTESVTGPGSIRTVRISSIAIIPPPTTAKPAPTPAPVVHHVSVSHGEGM